MHELQFKIKESHSGSFNLASGLESYWDAVVYTSYWNPKMYLEPFRSRRSIKARWCRTPATNFRRFFAKNKYDYE